MQALLAEAITTLNNIEARISAGEAMMPPVAPTVVKRGAEPAAKAAKGAASAAVPVAPVAAPAAVPAKGAEPADAAPVAAQVAGPVAGTVAAPAADKQNARLWFRDAFASGAGGLRALFDSEECRRENAEALKKHGFETEAYYKALGYQIWPKLSEARKKEARDIRDAGKERAARAADSSQLDEE